MRESLKSIVVPVLREKGFKGSFPHFSRRLQNRIDLLSFQFSLYGPALYVNVGQCGPNGVTYGDGTTYPPNKVRCHHVPLQTRVSAKGGSFDFERGELQRVTHSISSTIVSLLDEQAEPWWNDARGPTRTMGAS
jgi:hypothetical protein